MAMRYLIRRERADDLAIIRQKIEGLDPLLGPAADKLRRTIPVTLSPLRTERYRFQTRKVESGWIWVCPSVELVAENEGGLLEMAQTFGVERLPHLF